MKMLIKMVFFILLHTCIYADEVKDITKSGTVAISLNDIIGYCKYEDEIYKNYNYDLFINPASTLGLQVFIIDNLTIGGKLNLKYVKTFFTAKSLNSISNLAIPRTSLDFQGGPSIFYYIPLSKKYIPFFGLSYTYQSESVKYYNFYSDDIVIKRYIKKIHSFEGNVGGTLMLLNSLGMNVSYSYIMQKQKFKELNYKDKEGVDEITNLPEYEEYNNKTGRIHKISLGFIFFI